MSKVAGVWQRQWEEDPLGDEERADRDTLVLWTQSSSRPGSNRGIYVDIRTPLASPGRSIAAACEWGAVPDPSALASTSSSSGSRTRTLQRVLNSSQNPAHDLSNLFLRQKSFAGVLDFQLGDTTPTGDALKKDPSLVELAACQDPGAMALCTCFWRRDIDYQPPSGGLDIGVCASGPPNADGSILLRETGSDGSYAEGWLRLPGSEQGPFLALKLISENGHAGARDGYWVRAGSRFAYAVGRPKTVEAAGLLGCPEASSQIKDCVGKVLSEAIESISTDPSEILNIAFSYVVVAGVISEDDRKWVIHHSTNPELVGCNLVGDPKTDDMCCSRLIEPTGEANSEVQQVKQVVPRKEGDVVRQWEIVDQVGCDLPFSVEN